LDFECSTQTQESNYLFLLDLQQYLLKKLKAGAVIKDVYASGLAYVKEKKPELESAYPKTIGYGVRVARNPSSREPTDTTDGRSRPVLTSAIPHTCSDRKMSGC
jgi:nucleosome binding factor SPN SPT16 subunit